EATDATRQSAPLGEPLHAHALSVVLAESTAPGLAVEAAQWINDPDEQAMALLEAVCGAASCGRPRDSGDIARAISDPHRRAQALGWAAAAAARTGCIDLAGSLVQEMQETEDGLPQQPFRSGDHSRAALSAFAKALTVSGQDDAASSLAATAPNAWISAEILSAVVVGLIARGDDRKALSKVEDLAVSPRAPRALAPVAAAWVRAGSAPRALEAIQTLPRSEQQAEALSLAVQSLARSGHAVPQGPHLAGLACELADTLTSPTWPDYVLYEHVRALTGYGRHTLAAAVSQHIADVPLRARAVGSGDSLARTPARDPDEDVGDIAAEAAFLVELATDAHNNQWAVASTAAALAWTGEHDRARDLAQALPETFAKDEAIASVAEALAASGRYNEGTDLAKGVPDGLQQDRVLNGIARWAARRRDFRTAVDVAAVIGRHEEQSWALLTTVDLAVQEQQYGEAAAAARALTDTNDRVRALSTICAAARRHDAQSHAGQLTSELESLILDALNSDDYTRQRRGALKAAAAEGWGDSPSGRAAAIEALRLAPWHVCLRAVRRSAPQALQTAVHAVLHEPAAATASLAPEATGSLKHGGH
ncbi:hypothetical protein ACWD4T_11455, partial [Streptomyces umbrinus]